MRGYRRLEDIKTVRPTETMTMHLTPWSLAPLVKTTEAVCVQVFMALSGMSHPNRNTVGGWGIGTNVEMIAQSQSKESVSAEWDIVVGNKSTQKN